MSRSTVMHELPRDAVGTSDFYLRLKVIRELASRAELYIHQWGDVRLIEVSIGGRVFDVMGTVQNGCLRWSVWNSVNAVAAELDTGSLVMFFRG